MYVACKITSPQRYQILVLEPTAVAIYGKNFADVIMLRLLKWIIWMSPELHGWVLNIIANVLISER
jgi:hypothetical protein